MPNSPETMSNRVCQNEIDTNSNSQHVRFEEIDTAATTTTAATATAKNENNTSGARLVASCSDCGSSESRTSDKIANIGNDTTTAVNNNNFQPASDAESTQFMDSKQRALRSRIMPLPIRNKSEALKYADSTIANCHQCLSIPSHYASPLTILSPTSSLRPSGGFRTKCQDTSPIESPDQLSTSSCGMRLRSRSSEKSTARDQLDEGPNEPATFGLSSARLPDLTVTQIKTIDKSVVSTARAGSSSPLEPTLNRPMESLRFSRQLGLPDSNCLPRTYSATEIGQRVRLSRNVLTSPTGNLRRESGQNYRFSFWDSLASSADVRGPYPHILTTRPNLVSSHSSYWDRSGLSSMGASSSFTVEKSMLPAKAATNQIGSMNSGAPLCPIQARQLHSTAFRAKR